METRFKHPNFCLLFYLINRTITLDPALMTSGIISQTKCDFSANSIHYKQSVQSVRHTNFEIIVKLLEKNPPERFAQSHQLLLEEEMSDLYLLMFKHEHTRTIQYKKSCTMQIKHFATHVLQILTKLSTLLADFLIYEIKSVLIFLSLEII